MTIIFRILAGLNGLLLAVLFFYRASGEDPAGEGMRLGVATLYLIAFALVIGCYLLVRWRPVRLLMLALLSLPLMVTLYGISLMLG